MKVSGLQKCSMVDYPGKMAAVVFVPGCNLDCYYCQNRGLLAGGSATPLDPEDVLATLERRRGFLDGVVVSGGEPTLQPGLERFIVDLRELGYPVKLDTNGTRPAVLAELVGNRLVDYVAMDVKAPRSNYAAMAGRELDVDDVDASIQVLLRGSIDYEFRTTVAPEISGPDLLEIARWIRGARAYVLQQYRPLSAEWFGRSERLSPPPHEPGLLIEWADAIRRARLVRAVGLRGVGVQTVGAQPPTPAAGVFSGSSARAVSA